MLRPRWSKVLSDLWSNKVRSLLVVASIAVGLFTVGMVTSMYLFLSQDMGAGYAAINPANIQVAAANFDRDTLTHVRHLVGVRGAEGLRDFNLRVQTAAEEWQNIELFAVDHFDQREIARLRLVEGRYPDRKDEIAIEMNKLSTTHAGLGDPLTLKLPSGTLREMKIVGVLQDQSLGSAGGGGGFFLAPITAYVGFDALDGLGQDESFNLLYVTVTNDPNDLGNSSEVANRVSKDMDDNGSKVFSTITRRTTDHPNRMYVDAVSAILFLLGLLTVFLSGFLITNTLAALLNQQIQQIGVMKTVGARSHQIIGIYMLLIFAYGMIALVIAVPLANRGAYAVASFLSQRMNFILSGYRAIPAANILQAVIALIVPQVAGFFPIFSGARISPAQAISGIHGSSGEAKLTWLDNALAHMRKISRPLLISLRNTFRHKTRLILTLITLSLGGAIFIATFNVRASLSAYVDMLTRYLGGDVSVTFNTPYRLDKVDDALKEIPGVVYVEGWATTRCGLILPGGSMGESVRLLAPPVDSQLVVPKMIAGRWIQAGDSNAIAVNEQFLSVYPGLHTGQGIRLNVNGEDTDWIVVGIFRFAGKGAGLFAYTSYDYLSNLIHARKQAITYRVVAEAQYHTLAGQKELTRELDSYLGGAGFHIADVRAGGAVQTSTSEGFNTLLTFMLILAVLTAMVGSIGLAGTMSMNVMERTREIGILRAIGASNPVLIRMVLVEGLFIGLLSWALGMLLSLPVSQMMNDAISTAIFGASAAVSYSVFGYILWFVLVVALSVLASVIPARNAARLTIREVLAYE